MESFQHFKNTGLNKMKKKKFSKSIEDFTKVITSLDPKTDEEYILKCVCFLNRSSCYTQLGQYKEALEDTVSVVKLYNQARPEEKQKEMSQEQILKDPLTGVLHLAYVRRGECFEAQSQFLDAFQEYSQANILIPNGEGQKAMQNLLQKFKIPILDQSDKDLQKFSAILLHFLNEESLVQCFNSLIEFLNTEIPEQIIKKIVDTESTNILYGVMQLYSENQIIVDQILNCLQLLARKQVITVWNGFIIIKSIMMKWENDSNIIGDAIKFLCLSPYSLYKFYAKEHFIPLIVHALKININEEEVEDAFFLLFNIADTPSLLVELAAEEIIDIIFEKKTKGSLNLLCKICMLPDLLKHVKELNVTEWIFNILQQENVDEDSIVSSSLILSNLLIPENPDEKEKENLKLISQKSFDLLVPHVLKYTKNDEVVGHSFATFAIAIDHSPEKVKEHKLIILASVLLSLHMKSESVAQNLVSFLYECTKSGYLDDIKSTKAILPTVMKTLTTYPRNKVIVERSVALAYLLDHKNKYELIQSALLEFNESEFLDSFITEKGVFKSLVN